MTFVGFVYLNNQVRTACAQVRENLNDIFESVSTIPDDSARGASLMQTAQSEAQMIKRMVAQFAPVQDVLKVDGTRLTQGIEGEHVFTGLSQAFVNSCISLQPEYRDSGLTKDVSAVFVKPENGQMTMSFVAVDALPALAAASNDTLGIASEDAKAAVAKLPAYVQKLETGMFTAAVDVSPEMHASAALGKNVIRGASECTVRFVATNENGTPVETKSSTVKATDFGQGIPQRHAGRSGRPRRAVG